MSDCSCPPQPEGEPPRCDLSAMVRDDDDVQTATARLLQHALYHNQHRSQPDRFHWDNLEHLCEAEILMRERHPELGTDLVFEVPKSRV